MGGEDDGAVTAQILNHVADLNDLLGVKAHGRLVENQHIGVAHQCLGETAALLITAGQVADHTGAHLGNAHHFADSVDMRLAAFVCFLHALDVVDKVQVLVYSHVEVQGRILGQIADVLLGLQGIFQNVDARYLGSAGGGRQIAGDYIHRSGLTSAVGSKEANDLALVDGKGDVGNASLVAIGLGQSGYFNHLGFPPKMRAA